MVSIYIVFLALLVILTTCVLISISIYKRGLELSPYTRKIEDLKTKIIQFQANISKLEYELKHLEDKRQDVLDLINQKEEAKKFLDSHDEKIKEYEAEFAKLEDEKKDIIKEFEIQKKELEVLHQEKRELEELHDNLQRVVNSLKGEKEDISTQIASSKEKFEQLSKALDNLKISFQSLTAEYEKLKFTKNTLEQEIEKLKKEAEEKKKQQQELNQAISAQQAEIVKLKRIKYEYELDNTRNEAKDNLDERRWEDLDREVVEFKLKLKPHFNETSWLKEFKSNLLSNNIYFNDRIINAFHTSLKIGDKSPLVVLAGISGTGKSLLPQLYATAIGMNYLNVAVQPRWDSPQDMLGFYNYMQYKYKATELSRLLWQFDFYNNPKLKQEHGIKDEKDLPMNLVLLDEMNLAKVEYYFSDMLSKLEVRRTITADNAEQRRKAEIEIECASLSSNKASRRLFINNNTLFVGTMNEDETTQSLSDKVIDRSNMLRFGKPKKLQADANVQKFMGSYDSDEYLSLGKWNEINKQSGDLTTNNANKLNEIVSGINGELEKVGRPFAHRVYQSILGYVYAYPNANRDQVAFNNAVADQIEMKILPKLNGLEKSNNDVSDALKRIKDYVEKTKDTELIAEFERSIKDDGSDFFYKWKGVVRS